MAKPTWVQVVGILGIIFGCSGILGGSTQIFMPLILKFQKNMFSNIEKTMEEQNNNKNKNDNATPNTNNNDKKMQKEFINSFKNMLDVPSWYGTWCVITGIIQVLISAVMLLSAIFLLQLKKNSIPLFYWASGASILLCVIKAIVTFSTLSTSGIAMLLGNNFFGAVIDIVLIIVVATSSKEAFQPIKSEPIYDVE